MPYQTPLEENLERELAAVGTPFKNREMIYDRLEKHFAMQQLTPEQLQAVESPKLKEILANYKTTPLFVSWWLAHRRMTRTPSGLYLSYGIWTGEQNVEELNRLDNYDDIVALVEEIIKKRSFYEEAIDVCDNSNSTYVKPPHIPGISEEPSSSMPEASRTMEEELQADIDSKIFTLSVYPSPERVATDTRKYDYLLEGVTSGTTGAHLIAKRIAEFVGKNYHKLNP